MMTGTINANLLCVFYGLTIPFGKKRRSQPEEIGSLRIG